MNCLWRGNGHGAKGVAADVALCGGKGPINARPRKISPNPKFGLCHDVRTLQRLCWGSAHGRGDDSCVLKNCGGVSTSTERSFGSAHFKGPSKKNGHGGDPKEQPCKNSRAELKKLERNRVLTNSPDFGLRGGVHLYCATTNMLSLPYLDCGCSTLITYAKRLLGLVFLGPYLFQSNLGLWATDTTTYGARSAHVPTRRRLRRTSIVLDSPRLIGPGKNWHTIAATLSAKLGDGYVNARSAQSWHVSRLPSSAYDGRMRWRPRRLWQPGGTFPNSPDWPLTRRKGSFAACQIS